MKDADEVAKVVLKQLRQAFSCSGSLPSIDDLLLPTGVLVGMEVEVPWRAYYPHLWDKYFGKSEVGYSDFSKEKKEIFEQECVNAEELVLPFLRKTVDCGLKRGRDRYWEFIFPPVNNLCFSAEMVYCLKEARLLPWGHYSLHLTLSGGDYQVVDLFALLVILESLYVRPKRLEGAFYGQGSWSRKGEGGLLIKDSWRWKLLYDQNSAWELRTLELPGNFDTFLDLLNDLQLLLSIIANDRIGWIKLKKELILSFRKYGLPWKKWGKPVESPELWGRYLECLPALKVEIKSLVRSVFDN